MWWLQNFFPRNVTTCAQFFQKKRKSPSSIRTSNFFGHQDVKICLLKKKKNTRYNTNFFITNIRLEAFWKHVHRLRIVSLLEVASTNWVTSGNLWLKTMTPYKYICILSILLFRVTKKVHTIIEPTWVFFFNFFHGKEVGTHLTFLSFFNRMHLWETGNNSPTLLLVTKSSTAQNKMSVFKMEKKKKTTA